MSQENAEGESWTTPAETGVTSSNDIVEIDAHLEENHPDHPMHTPPEVTPEELGMIADGLAEVGQLDASAQFEILRRYIAEDPEFVPRFTAGELTDLVIRLAVAKTALLSDPANDPVLDAIQSFGRVVQESEPAPMDVDWAQRDIPGLEPSRADHDYVDPFKAIAGQQGIIFDE